MQHTILWLSLRVGICTATQGLKWLFTHSSFNHYHLLPRFIVPGFPASAIGVTLIPILPNQPRLCDLVFTNATPLTGRYPPDIRPVPEPTDPINLLHNQPSPPALMDLVTRQPRLGVWVAVQEASLHAVRQDLGGRYRLDVTDQAEPRHIRGRIRVDVIARRGRRRRMPAQGQRDIGAGAHIAERGGDADGEDGGAMRLRGARGIVVHQTYGGTAEVRGGVREGGGGIFNGGC